MQKACEHFYKFQCQHLKIKSGLVDEKGLQDDKLDF